MMRMKMDFPLTGNYDYVGAVTEEEADELRRFTAEFKDEVITWLAAHYPELTSNF